VVIELKKAKAYSGNGLLDDIDEYNRVPTTTMETATINNPPIKRIMSLV